MERTRASIEREEGERWEGQGEGAAMADSPRRRYPSRALTTLTPPPPGLPLNSLVVTNRAPHFVLGCPSSAFGTSCVIR